jgi:hypothetical protein
MRDSAPSTIPGQVALLCALRPGAIFRPEREDRRSKILSVGEVLKGVIKPWQCKVFGSACTPETPLGALMVSSEGACSAYYKYGGVKQHQPEPAVQGAA